MQQKHCPITATEITQTLRCSHFKTTKLKGDGSQKLFFRIELPEEKKSYIVMQIDNTPTKNYDYWISIHNTLKTFHIKCPKIIKRFDAKNTLIIEDFGNKILCDVIKNTSRGLFQYLDPTALIIKNLLQIPQETKTHSWNTRSFQAQQFWDELNFFKTHHIQASSFYTSPHWNPKVFSYETKILCNEIAKDCNYFTHRDFHSRNLMLQNNDISLIDFQDARLGPPSYDLVSFCFDPYLELTPPERLEILEQIKPKSLHISPDTWKAVLLQRLLKAIGSFEYLSKIKSPSDYKPFIKKALNIILEVDLFNPQWPYISRTLVKELQNHATI